MLMEDFLGVAVPSCCLHKGHASSFRFLDNFVRRDLIVKWPDLDHN